MNTIILKKTICQLSGLSKPSKVYVYQGILIVRIDTQAQQKLILACQRIHSQKSKFHHTQQTSPRNLLKQIDQQRRKLLPLNILNFINICVELHNSFLTKNLVYTWSHNVSHWSVLMQLSRHSLILKTRVQLIKKIKYKNC